MHADRRKNSRLRKYHYSKILNAGDSVAPTGVPDIGFKSGSLPHDPGGITCMLEVRQVALAPQVLQTDTSMKPTSFCGMAVVVVDTETAWAIFHINTRALLTKLYLSFDYSLS